MHKLIPLNMQQIQIHQTTEHKDCGTDPSYLQTVSFNKSENN